MSDDRKLIMRWLADIGETDPDVIAEVVTRCKTDPAARAYFVERAREAQEKKVAA